MSLSKIWVLGTNTFREAVRDRVFHSILFFAVGVVVFSLKYFANLINSLILLLFNVNS